MTNKSKIVRRCSNLGLFPLDLILDYLPKNTLRIYISIKSILTFMINAYQFKFIRALMKLSEVFTAHAHQYINEFLILYNIHQTITKVSHDVADETS
jgi:hypothetical protein